MMTSLVCETASGVLSLVFPSHCPGCDSLDEESFCKECRKFLKPVNLSVVCARCGECLESHETNGKVCSKCKRSPPPYDMAISAYIYEGPIVRAMRLWKYHGHRYISAVLSELLTNWMISFAPEWLEKINGVVPVPHHQKTIRAREFSPPEDIASKVANAFNLQYMPRTVFKTRFTSPQVGLCMSERVQNVKNSMRVFDESLVSGKNILIIDDVMTTGATLSECARALRSAGAGKIYCITIARQYC